MLPKYKEEMKMKQPPAGRKYVNLTAIINMSFNSLTSQKINEMHSNF